MHILQMAAVAGVIYACRTVTMLVGISSMKLVLTYVCMVQYFFSTLRVIPICEYSY